LTDTRSRWLIPSLAAVLYVTQGFPYGVVTELMPLYLRQAGWSLTQIGFIQTIALAWVWKALWSPLVDLLGTYRRWIAGALIVITAALAVLALTPATNTTVIWLLIAVIALASATQDIAIDAQAIRMTPEKLLGYVNSFRVAGYRGAMIVAGGALAALSDLAGWRGAFLTGAAITAVLLLATRLLPRDTGDTTTHANPFAGLARWLRRPQAAVLLALALTYRLGDAALTPMVKPFWVDAGYSATEIGTVTTVIGLSFLIAGAFVGGAYISRFGIVSALFWLGVLQMLSNGGYGLLATFGGGRTAFYAAAIIENFTGGLGTAAFLAFMMSICDREHAATQYAMLTALFGITRSLIGTASGAAAQNLGYATWFWITLALGLPGLLLVPLLRGAIRTDESPAS
jgi:PAT family beta-lactamase induction signal transducer AmpG